MARYGAKYIRWAPFAEQNPEPAGAFPSYGTAIGLAEMQKVSDNPNFAEGTQYGDDGLQEYMNEFRDADVDIEVTDLPVDIEKPVLGVTHTAKTGSIVCVNVADTPPYGGVGFVSCIIRKNVRKYQAIIYPKAKAAMQGDEYVTKGESLTLSGGKLKFKIAACETGDWKLKSTYQETEAAAKALVDDFFGGKITLDTATE